ncbi:HDOD domain protein [Thiorhodovibrio winogradskyi]|uniref:HDOD domain protein n=1 Tax=Thiorhodovibrio winogradskyi TaxID=77007 RepID=A0ABZ0SJF4_9GAMM|nr:HDOD domain-containing protein [Thiorhodovibrio winogradskyi]
MTATDHRFRPSDQNAGTGTWTLVAPVFDQRRQRSGLWLEIASTPDQAGSLLTLLVERLQEHPPEWLFLVDTTKSLAHYLPLDLNCDQMLVRSLAKDTETTSLNDSVLLGIRGTRAELARVSNADWHIVTDPVGPVSTKPALADGLAGWQQCQALADLGWTAFMMTGNQGANKKQHKADQIALTRLLALVTSDADTDELESLFKSQPRLAFDLLNLVNSPALNLRTPATNFRHAITLLGRRQLQRWLQLLMFTRQTIKGEVNILLWHSALRGRLMELLAQHLSWPAELSDQAFMVGIFSLLDVLMNDQLENLLTPLALPESILTALLGQQGPLGDLLALASAIEQRKTSQVGTLSQRYHLDAVTLLQLQLDSLFWVESFSSPPGN